jgi:hypothetical protein
MDGRVKGVFIMLFVVLISLWSLSYPTQKAAQDITARQLRSLMGSPDGYDPALRVMSDFYRVQIKGEGPDDELRVGLGDIFLEFLTKNPEYLDRPASELLAKAFGKVPALIEEQKAMWTEALKAAKAYYPTLGPELAKAFFMALPDHRIPRLAFDKEVLVSRVAFADENMKKLEGKFDEGEPNAVDVGFRLLNISDGAAGEWLFHALGTILPNHPRLFLEKAVAHLGHEGRGDSDRILDGILHPVGWWEIPENDRDHVKYKELRNVRIDMRIKALRTVQDPQLSELRDRCILLLEKKRNEILG